MPNRTKKRSARKPRPFLGDLVSFGSEAMGRIDMLCPGLKAVEIRRGLSCWRVKKSNLELVSPDNHGIWRVRNWSEAEVVRG